MKQLIKHITDWRSTIPGLIVIIATNVAFFTKMIDWPAYIAGMASGAGLVGINTRKKSV